MRCPCAGVKKRGHSLAFPFLINFDGSNWKFRNLLNLAFYNFNNMCVPEVVCACVLIVLPCCMKFLLCLCVSWQRQRRRRHRHHDCISNQPLHHWNYNAGETKALWYPLCLCIHRISCRHCLPLLTISYILFKFPH